MNLRDLADKALFYLSVPKCVGCGERLKYEDNAVCPECYRKFTEASNRNCSRCSKVLSRCTCSMDYLEKCRVKRVVKLFRYIQRDENYATNSLIYSLKRDNRQDVLDFCANRLADAILSTVNFKPGTIITNVPRRKRSIINYGIDHAELLARALGQRIGVEYRKIFVSQNKEMQKSLHGDERRYNANYVIKDKTSLKGISVIIVDDVITTGASMGAVATLASSLGAREIIGAAIGIAYKDQYEFPKELFVTK